MGSPNVTPIYGAAPAPAAVPLAPAPTSVAVVVPDDVRANLLAGIRNHPIAYSNVAHLQTNVTPILVAPVVSSASIPASFANSFFDPNSSASSVSASQLPPRKTTIAVQDYRQMVSPVVGTIVRALGSVKPFTHDDVNCFMAILNKDAGATAASALGSDGTLSPIDRAKVRAHAKTILQQFQLDRRLSEMELDSIIALLVRHDVLQATLESPVYAPAPAPLDAPGSKAPGSKAQPTGVPGSPIDAKINEPTEPPVSKMRRIGRVMMIAASIIAALAVVFALCFIPLNFIAVLVVGGAFLAVAGVVGIIGLGLFLGGRNRTPAAAGA